MEKIKTGLAAFGMSGQIFHAPFISTNPNFELTAITERTKELSKERYPSARIVRSFDELLAIDELELIVVNTPDSTHYDYTRRALEAGKHVIVEKPFTTTAKEGEELVALAKSKGLALSVYQNRRWDSDFLTVKKIIEKRYLGRLVEFESTFPRYRNFIKPGTWKETGELGGGLTYNLGAHVIDQAVQLFGIPEAIFADIATLRTNGMVDDYFIIHLLRPSKIPEIKITLKSSYLMCEPEPRFVLHGTEGSFVKYGLDRQEADLNAGLMPNTPNWGEEDKSIWGILHTEKEGKIVREKFPSCPGNYAGFYDNIQRHIRYGEPLTTDATSVLPTIRLIEAAWESSRTKKIITLNICD
ncbi:Gfo/Idh/MocA family oxidoreductase [Parabacteroides sp. AM08-6]|uniref:Gfo/Idh/MocA family oxidoreductase n=1 Tax=Parabacteroides sp. AM08-6 TaxID=2292053 RepID=UPI000EFE889B|nr:Gfo/Idh/MocA family oxidoreductase [Parabacteroides sp. AM08-6]RHJ87739.1 oxidoreductase [Parabacteroides sp. AM08-6]